MTNQPRLCTPNTTWRTFVGGAYKDPQQFIREAQAIGFSRRIPARIARSMRFGDRIVFLRQVVKGLVEVLGEGHVTSIILEDGIGGMVARELASEGRASFNGTNASIQRECGSYMICGSWSVDADIDEIIEMGMKIADERGITLFCLVSGKLTYAYENPVLLSPAPTFFRGFAKDPDAGITYNYTHEFQGDNLTLITDYKRKG